MTDASIGCYYDTVRRLLALGSAALGGVLGWIAYLVTVPTIPMPVPHCPGPPPTDFSLPIPSCAASIDFVRATGDPATEALSIFAGAGLALLILTAIWLWKVSVRRVLLAGFVGAIVGVGAFVLTSQQDVGKYLGFCQPGVAAGFDPWTGLPHGSFLYCIRPYVVGGGPLITPTASFPTPPEIANRQAIPVPLGFVVGAGAVFLLLRGRPWQGRPGESHLVSMRSRVG